MGSTETPNMVNCYLAPYITSLCKKRI
ncbi:uncharacterized protein G2W53_025542 [Senna tora]|uniref:Uncharacterized protein n=1 Tax=Senna tora TaxID=362788 RepID=A0A834WEV7_9FABA|nr:uncharacterized protein G2W53_025542 [Senna tora]